MLDYGGVIYKYNSTPKSLQSVSLHLDAQLFEFSLNIQPPGVLTQNRWNSFFFIMCITEVKSCFVNVFLSTDQDECGCGSQRGEPKHPSDEQSRDLADLRTWCWCASHRAPEHTLLQRARGVDSNKCHSQLSKFNFLSCCVSAAIWASETNQAVQGFFLHRERLFRWCQKEQQKIWLRGEKECNSMLWIALHKLKYDISDFQLLYFTQALDKPAKLQWFGHGFQSVHAPNVLQEMLWVTAQTDLVGWAVVYFRFANTHSHVTRFR